MVVPANTEQIDRLLASLQALGHNLPTQPRTESEEEMLATINAVRDGDPVASHDVTQAQGYVDRLLAR